MSDALKKLQDQGIEDAKQHRRPRRPHGFLESLITWSGEKINRCSDENRAYSDGYYYTLGQYDAQDGRQRCPRNLDDRDAYLEGWQAVRPESG